MTFTRTAAAILLAMKGPDVKQLVDDEIIDRLPNGRYELGAVARYVEWLRAKIETKGDYSALSEQEKYRQKRRVNDLAMGRAFPVEVWGEVLGHVVTAWLPVLEDFPITVKRKLAGSQW